MVAKGQAGVRGGQRCDGGLEQRKRYYGTLAVKH